MMIKVLLLLLLVVVLIIHHCHKICAPRYISRDLGLLQHQWRHQLWGTGAHVTPQQ